MTPDDIIAVIERGLCHGADKAAECDVCARKRAAIAEVRTGREQLLAALAGIAERDAEIERLRADVERLTSHGTRLLFRLADLRARDERIARVIGAARELHDAMCVGTCDDRDTARYRLHGALAALDDAAEIEAANYLLMLRGAGGGSRLRSTERRVEYRDIGLPHPVGYCTACHLPIDCLSGEDVCACEPEPPSEMLARLQAMAADDLRMTWDLSDGDRAAIAWILGYAQQWLGAAVAYSHDAISEPGDEQIAAEVRADGLDPKAEAARVRSVMLGAVERAAESAEQAAMRLALRNVRALAKRLRRTDAENAAHLLRFCDAAGVGDEFLRAERHRDRAQQRIGTCLSMPPELAAAELRAISEVERADEEGER